MDADFLVVGAGIVGLATAARLAGAASVIVIDQEDQIGFHSTGRSAAILVDDYEHTSVQQMTAFSRAELERLQLEQKIELLSPRGLLRIQLAECCEDPTPLADREVSIARAVQLVPALRADAIRGAYFDPRPADMDVHALSMHYLSKHRARGGRLLLGQRLLGAEYVSSSWRLRFADRTLSVGAIVNAAGAWATDVARLCGAAPLDIQPLRRSAAIVEIGGDYPVRDWPMVVNLEQSLYFKPESGALMVSPADETPSIASDVWPDDLELAEAIDRFERLVISPVRRLRRSWAGLRSFAPDRMPVIGRDPHATNFIWAAGLGGFGVQTAPATGALVAAAALQNTLSAPELTAIAEQFTPSRFDLKRDVG